MPEHGARAVPEPQCAITSSPADVGPADVDCSTSSPADVGPADVDCSPADVDTADVGPEHGARAVPEPLVPEPRCLNHWCQSAARPMKSERCQNCGA